MTSSTGTVPQSRQWRQAGAGSGGGAAAPAARGGGTARWASARARAIAPDATAASDAARGLRAAWQRFGPPAGLPPVLVASWTLTEVQLSLAAGERNWAADAVRRLQVALGPSGDGLVCESLLHRAAGRAELARRSLDPMLRGEVAGRAVETPILARLVAAEALQTVGREQRAVVLLREAVEAATPDRLLQPFLVVDGCRLLLARNLDRFGAGRELVAEVIARTSVAGTELPQLTVTELEVLRELPTLRTVAEIADGRSVSPNTVKTHIRSIYRKLDVEGRRAAVDRANELGLL